MRCSNSKRCTSSIFRACKSEISRRRNLIIGFFDRNISMIFFSHDRNIECIIFFNNTSSWTSSRKTSLMIPSSSRNASWTIFFSHDRNTSWTISSRNVSWMISFSNRIISCMIFLSHDRNSYCIILNRNSPWIIFFSDGNSCIISWNISCSIRATSISSSKMVFLIIRSITMALLLIDIHICLWI
uniref:Candidate secreted effector n=1 Tax=Meloidogyne incognita TaxID=6306 RepID=A0A914M8E1_MELIC